MIPEGQPQSLESQPQEGLCHQCGDPVGTNILTCQSCHRQMGEEAFQAALDAQEEKARKLGLGKPKRRARR